MLCRSVLAELGCDVTRIQLRLLGVGGEGNAELLKLIRADAVTAAVFPADRRMLHFVDHARRVGVHVPRDVSVIGCDGVLEGLSYMELASLRIPVELVSRRAVEVDRKSVV